MQRESYVDRASDSPKACDQFYETVGVWLGLGTQKVLGIIVWVKTRTQCSVG